MTHQRLRQACARRRVAQCFFAWRASLYVSARRFGVLVARLVRKDTVGQVCLLALAALVFLASLRMHELAFVSVPRAGCSDFKGEGWSVCCTDYSHGEFMNHMYVYIHMHMYVCVHVCPTDSAVFCMDRGITYTVYINTYLCACLSACMHAYIHIYTYTHIPYMRLHTTYIICIDSFPLRAPCEGSMHHARGLQPAACLAALPHARDTHEAASATRPASNLLVLARKIRANCKVRHCFARRIVTRDV